MTMLPPYGLRLSSLCLWQTWILASVVTCLTIGYAIEPALGTPRQTIS